MKREKIEHLALDFEGGKQLFVVDSYHCPKYTRLNFDLIKANVDYTEEAANKLNKITEDYIKPRLQTHKKLSPYSLATHKGAYFPIKVLTIDADRIRKQMLAVFQDEHNLQRINRYPEKEILEKELKK